MFPNTCIPNIDPVGAELSDNIQIQMKYLLLHNLIYLLLHQILSQLIVCPKGNFTSKNANTNCNTNAFNIIFLSISFLLMKTNIRHLVKQLYQLHLIIFSFSLPIF